MARYIDQKDVYELLGERGMAMVHCSQVDELPRADVAPKAAVAMEIFEKIETLCESYKYFCEGTYAPELKEAIAELKKKYTEPEPPKAKQPKDSENYEKKRLLAGDCFHGEIWCRCPYCFTGIEVHSIPKDRICHNCGKEYL
jgi:hypothetical protein